jgi:hypothetical protein
MCAATVEGGLGLACSSVGELLQVRQGITPVHLGMPEGAGVFLCWYSRSSVHCDTFVAGFMPMGRTMQQGTPEFCCWLASQHVTADLHYGLCCGVQVKGAGLQEEQIAYICAESLKVSGAPLAIVAVLQTALSRLNTCHPQESLAICSLLLPWVL